MTKRSTSPGLRLQIVVALAGVILVAYLPLFFAIAQVARGSAIANREAVAQTLGRNIAVHVAHARAIDGAAFDDAMRLHLGDGSAIAIAVFGPNGDVIAATGEPSERARISVPPRPYHAGNVRVAAASGRAVDVTVASGDTAVVVRVKADDDQRRSAQLVRGIALYMSVFALGLLVFAYIVLTRTIVRPIEHLARATDKVAGGGRDLDLPTSGAREIAELSASVREMTARLLADEQALRAKVAELTATTGRLTKTRQQLAGSEHMASIGKLAAGIAHEIGNPITAIMGMHDLLGDAETNAETRVDFLRRMRKETERIHIVVRDLLDFARPELESEVPPSTAVAEIVDDTFSLVRPQKDFKGIAITAEIEPGLRVALSPQRLTQVLLNLLLNAGSALSRSPGARAIAVRARGTPAHVRIEVEDTGPGVPREVAPRIFDPFVTTRDVGEGTGLGLAVCQGIVEGAGGRIFLDRDFAGGARFVVELRVPETPG